SQHDDVHGQDRPDHLAGPPDEVKQVARRRLQAERKDQCDEARGYAERDQLLQRHRAPRFATSPSKTDPQSLFMLTSVMPYSSALSSASTSGLSLKPRS